MSISTIKVKVAVPGKPETNGEVRRQSWDQPARTRRALKVLGICWLLAVVTVVIPLAHFVLVPGFFLAGPIAAWFVYSQQSVILDGSAICPNCGQSLPIAKSSDQWPLTDLCTKCQKQVTITSSSYS